MADKESILPNSLSLLGITKYIRQESDSTTRFIAFSLIMLLCVIIVYLFMRFGLIPSEVAKRYYEIPYLISLLSFLYVHIFSLILFILAGLLFKLLKKEASLMSYGEVTINVILFSQYIRFTGSHVLIIPFLLTGHTFGASFILGTRVGIFSVILTLINYIGILWLEQANYFPLISSIKNTVLFLLAGTQNRPVKGT